MTVYSYSNKNDTVLERDGDSILFTFYPDAFTYDDPYVLDFRMAQNDLLERVRLYMSGASDAELEDLSVPALTALWSALEWLNLRDLEV